MKNPADVKFDKYAEIGAYHWREVGGNLIYHHSCTAERYRRVLQAAAPLEGKRVLDYGCGDGALLGWLSQSVRESGEAVGFEPVAEARCLAEHMLRKHSLRAKVCGSIDECENDSYDRVICSEVIEHVNDVQGLIGEIHRLLKPGGLAVVTTPIRLTEVPEEPTHVREWFPSEFVALFERGPLKLLRHEQVIPAATPEVFFWRPRFLLRVPVFRLMCNALSIYFHVNALSWLRMRPRLFMTQIALLQKLR